MCFNTEISILDWFIVECEVHCVGVYHLMKWKKARWNTEIWKILSFSFLIINLSPKNVIILFILFYFILHHTHTAGSCCGVVCTDNEVYLVKPCFLRPACPHVSWNFWYFFPILCISTACLPFEVRVSGTILYLGTYCRWIFAVIFD